MGDYEFRWREPYHSSKEIGAPSPTHEVLVEGGIRVERDVPVPLRDGTIVYADVFRPADESQVAPIIARTPYDKHQNGADTFADGKAEVPTGRVSPLPTFEGPDPGYLVPRGSAVVNIDVRGVFWPEGDVTYVSPEEARDFYDAAEWARIQPWSHGKVGLSGVSYLAVAPWRVTALRPPHLAAINLWEGWSDTYREVVRHGGIPYTWFWGVRLAGNWGTSTNRIEELVVETTEHPLFDEFRQSKAATDPEQIEVPAHVVACWADQGLNLRGTLGGYKAISSAHKWLVVHGRRKWAYYYKPGSVERLREFFDHFLPGRNSVGTSWPKVCLEVRERYFVGAMRAEGACPMTRARYLRLHLDARDASLSRAPVERPGRATYDALGSGPGEHRAVFEIFFDEATELIGHAKACLHISCEGADDMDVFLGLYKPYPAGTRVPSRTTRSSTADRLPSERLVRRTVSSTRSTRASTSRSTPTPPSFRCPKAAASVSTSRSGCPERASRPASGCGSSSRTPISRSPRRRSTRSTLSRRTA